MKRDEAVNYEVKPPPYWPSERKLTRANIAGSFVEKNDFLLG
jgi:hypothetical protein